MASIENTIDTSQFQEETDKITLKVLEVLDQTAPESNLMALSSTSTGANMMAPYKSYGDLIVTTGSSGAAVSGVYQTINGIGAGGFNVVGDSDVRGSVTLSSDNIYTSNFGDGVSTSSGTSSTSGSVQTVGGAGVGSFYVAGNSIVTGNLSMSTNNFASVGILNSYGNLITTGTSNATDTSSGSIITDAGIGSILTEGNLIINGNVSLITNNIASVGSQHTGTDISTDTTGGDIVISGGLTVGSLNVINASTFYGNASLGTNNITSVGSITSTGQISVNNTIGTSSVTTGAIHVAGGIGAAGLYIGGNSTLAGNLSLGQNDITTVQNINSTGTVVFSNINGTSSSSTGSLQVHGGASFGSVYVEGTSTFNNAVNLGTNSINSVNSINSSGVISVSNTTQSTSKTTGAVQVAGGIGADSIYIDNDATINGSLILPEDSTLTLGTINASDMTLSNASGSSSTTTGSLQVAGGIGTNSLYVASSTVMDGSLSLSSNSISSVGDINSSGKIIVSDSTASSSKTTGAIQVAGGVGMNNLYVDSTTTLNGNLTLNTNAISSVGNINSSGIVSITSTDGSTNSNTGSLKVTGGIGVGGASSFANTVSFASTTTAPTQSSSDNSTKVATTSFVQTVLSNNNTVLGAPTGFENTSDSVITYSGTTRILSITPTSSSYNFYVQGTKYTKTTTISMAAHDATQGASYYYYFDATGTLQSSSSVPSYYNTAMIAFVYYYSASVYVCTEERHGCVMDPATHTDLHMNIGAYYVSGLTASGYTLAPAEPQDSHNNFSITSGVISDESLNSNISAISSGGPYQIIQLTGSSNGTWLWSSKTSPFYNVTNGYVQYNQYNGGNWSLTSLSSGQWVNYYVIFVPSLSTNTQVFLIPGQTVYTSLVDAQAENLGMLNMVNIPFPEYVPQYRITYGTNSSYASTGKCRIDSWARLLGTEISIINENNAGEISNHQSLAGLQFADYGVTYGHINDQTQSIYGNKTFASSANSTSSTTGSIQVVGGMGINGRIFMSSTENVTNSLTGSIVTLGGVNIQNTTEASGSTMAALLVSGGMSVGKSAIVLGNETSSSTTTGALQVQGGAGLGSLYVQGNSTINGSSVMNGSLAMGSNNISSVGSITSSGLVNLTNSSYPTNATTGAINITGGANIRSTAESTGLSNAAFVVAGGASIGKSLSIFGTDGSSSTTTGALKVSGGAGVDSLYVNNASVLNGTLNVTGQTTLNSSAVLNGNLTMGTNSISSVGGISSSGVINITNSTTASGTTTGALVIVGGVNISNTINASGSTGGSLLVAGGVAIGKSVTVSSTTGTSSITTGAVQVAGGVGANSLYVKELSYLNGGIQLPSNTANTWYLVTLVSGTHSYQGKLTYTITSSGTTTIDMNVYVWMNNGTINIYRDDLISSTTIIPRVAYYSDSTGYHLYFGANQSAGVMSWTTGYNTAPKALWTACGSTASTPTDLDGSPSLIYDSNSNGWTYGNPTFGSVKLINTTQSTSSTTGSLVISGGIGANNMNIANLAISGTGTSVTPSSTDNSTNIATTAYVQSNLSSIAAATLSPTGFENTTSSTISYNSTSRVFTIAPSSTSYNVWVQGVKYVKSGSLSTTAHASTAGILYYVYFDNTGTLQISSSMPDFYQSAMVAAIYYYSATVYMLLEERHGTSMDPATHIELHQQIGTYYVSGLAASGYNLSPGTPTDADNQIAIATGVISDEQLNSTITALPSAGPYTVMQMTGSSALWTWTTTNTVPFNYSAGGYIQYNQNNAGTWQLTQLTNSQYINYYICFAPSTSSTTQTLIIPGQTTYASSSAAASENFYNLTLTTLPFPEILPLYQVIFRASSSYTNTGKCRIEGFNRIVGTRTTILNNTATNHNSLSGLQLSGTGVTYGHIDDQAQTIYGVKTFADTTSSNSTTTGSLVVSGGMGIAKNVYMGNNANISGKITSNGIVKVGLNTANEWFLVCSSVNTAFFGEFTIEHLTLSSRVIIRNLYLGNVMERIDSINTGANALRLAMYLDGSNATYYLYCSFTAAPYAVSWNPYGLYSTLPSSIWTDCGVSSSVPNNMTSPSLTYDSDVSGWTATSSKIFSSTLSTSTTTGAFQVVGGIGANSLFVGNATISGTSSMSGNLTVSNTGIVSIQNTTVSTSTTTGSLQVAGGVIISNNSGSSSTTTGALIVLGGANIQGASVFGSTVSITGASTLTGNATLGGTLTVTGASTLTGASTFGNNLTVLSTGTVAIQNTTVSTSTTTGSLQVAGGVIISNNSGSSSTTTGALIVLGGANIQGASVFGSTVSITGASTLTGNATLGGTLTVTGASTHTGASTFGNNLTVLSTGTVAIQNTTVSTSTTTGSLQVAGGVIISNNSGSSSTTTGALIVLGGANIQGASVFGSTVNIGGTVKILNTTESTDTTTGSLNISGGVSIDKNLYLASALVSKTSNDNMTYFNALGNSTLDSTSQINTAISSMFPQKIIGLNKYYTCTTAVTNPNCCDFDENIKIFAPSFYNIGQRSSLYNSYAHKQQPIFNIETLYGWYQKLHNNTANLKVLFSGDSTTATGTTDTGYVTTDLFKTLAVNDGWTDFTVYNRGASGRTTVYWDSNLVSTDISTYPSDLYILRWGINDSGWSNYDTTTMTTALRSGLSKLRTAFPLTDGVGIILMMPNSFNSTTQNSNEIYNENLRKVIIQCAIDYQCCFIDTYSLFQNSRDGYDDVNAKALWMDGGHTHPRDNMNILIINKLYEIVCPKYYVNFKAKTNPINYKNYVSIPSSAYCKFYLSGLSLYPELNKSGISYISNNATVPTIVNDRLYVPGASLCQHFLGSNTYGSVPVCDDNIQVGCVNCRFIPTLTSATQNLYLINIGKILVRNSSSGVWVIAYNSVGALAINSFLPSFTWVAGTEYELEIDYDFTAGTFMMFINGTQHGSTISVTPFTAGTSTQIVFGAGGAGGNGYYSCYAFYSGVQMHTANYTISQSPNTIVSNSYIKLGNTDYGNNQTVINNEGITISKTALLQNTTITKPTNALWYATYYNNLYANLTGSYGSSCVPTTTGTVAYQNHAAIFSATNSYLTYNINSSVDVGNVMSFRFNLVTQYNGPNSTNVGILSVGGIGTSNNLYFYHANSFSSGALKLLLYGASKILDISFGNWSPTANTVYEFLLNINITTGSNQLFIDGTQFGSTDTTTGTRTGGASNFYVGFPSASYASLFLISNLIIYSAAPYTANYTKGYTLPESLENLKNMGVSNLNKVWISNPENSTNLTTGSLILTGGEAITGNLNIGGNEILVGTMTIQNTTAGVSTSTGALIVAGGVGIAGTVTKGGGSFSIPHPDPTKSNWTLRHCFVESNTRGDNLYRYQITTKDLHYVQPLPSYFKYLNENPQVFITPAQSLGYGFGIVDSELENVNITVSTDGVYNVLIIGTRKDQLMIDFWDNHGGAEIPPE